MLRNVLFAVPVFGWMLRSAWYGDAIEKLFFLANVLALWVFAIYFIGYAALIVPLLALAGLYLIAMVVLTAGDLLSNHRPAARRAVAPAPRRGRTMR